MLDGFLRFVRYASGLVGAVGLIGSAVWYRRGYIHPLWTEIAILGLSLVVLSALSEVVFGLMRRRRRRR